MKNAQQELHLEIYNMTFDSINNLMNVSQKEINDLSKQIISSNNLDLLPNQMHYQLIRL